MSRIVVDLTPLLPEGTNGGAKIMTLELIKQLAKLAPKHQFTLLGTKKNMAELASIQTNNVKAVCITRPPITLANIPILLMSACVSVALKIAERLPHSFFKIRLAHLWQGLHCRLLAKNLSADLLLCPFTAPFYHNHKIPTVSIIHDLQWHYYPFFFTKEEYFERKKHFYNACRYATKLICTSDYVKKTAMDNSKVSPTKFKTIPICLAHRLPYVGQNHITKILSCYHLTEQLFLLFPANFWAHKNHTMLFTAFNIYRAQYPQSNIKLVCTGADNVYKQLLLDTVKKMGLDEWIIMPGFLSDIEFASLMAGCRAVIFPSLFEGFGMPILEAMAHKKPVLCSNLTSLPEIAGTATLLFDPRKPTAIVAAIHRIEYEPALLAELAKRGTEHVKSFGTATDMAKEYLSVFQEVMQ
jgi:glycosyltransferase involved in cell wall biosynthesis